MGKARSLITGLMLVAAVAGCSSHPSAPKSTLSQTSYTAGFKVGESISLPNETATQMQSNCADSAVQKMPGTDVKSSWIDGCMAGIIQAEITAGDSG